MKLALSEIRRTRGRFASVTAALSLIVFLVLVLSALADGLWLGATGALRNTGSDVFTFSSDGRKSFIRSRMSEADVARVAAVPGVSDAGGVGTLLGTGSGPQGELDIALFGFMPGRPGGPEKVAEGRGLTPGDEYSGIADQSFKDRGVKIGDRLKFTGSDQAIEVVGFANDTRYQLQPTLWTSINSWRSIRDQARPELRGRPDAINFVAVAVADGESPVTVADRITSAVNGTESLTQIGAILALPGTEQQRSTFDTIVYVTFAIAGLVVALFFALLTLEKRNLFAMLKALGASTRYLVSGTLLQAFFCCVAGLIAGGILAAILGEVLPTSIPAIFLPRTAATLAIATVITGLSGAALSLRRISRIDPASALGGTL